jgi:hypothetical protein
MKSTPVEQKSLPPGCANCRGASHVPDPQGGARRCDCARGQALGKLEYERKHPAPKPAKQRRSTHDGKAAAVGEA